MRRILLLSFLFVLVLAVSAQDKKLTRKEKKAQHQALLTQQTKKLIEASAWQFNATRMIPLSGRSRTLTTPYNVVLNNEIVDSYLPYFGRAYSAEYGSSESPMIFEAAIEDYNVEDAKKDGYLIKFSARNKNDNLDFTFSVSSNGSASLIVTSTNRQQISFHGDLVPIEQK